MATPYAPEEITAAPRPAVPRPVDPEQLAVDNGVQYRLNEGVMAPEFYNTPPAISNSSLGYTPEYGNFYDEAKSIVNSYGMPKYDSYQTQLQRAKQEESITQKRDFRALRNYLREPTSNYERELLLRNESVGVDDPRERAKIKADLRRSFDAKDAAWNAAITGNYDSVASFQNNLTNAQVDRTKAGYTFAQPIFDRAQNATSFAYGHDSNRKVQNKMLDLDHVIKLRDLTLDALEAQGRGRKDWVERSKILAESGVNPTLIMGAAPPDYSDIINRSVAESSGAPPIPPGYPRRVYAPTPPTATVAPPPSPAYYGPPGAPIAATDAGAPIPIDVARRSEATSPAAAPAPAPAPVPAPVPVPTAATPPAAAPVPVPTAATPPAAAPVPTAANPFATLAANSAEDIARDREKDLAEAERKAYANEIATRLGAYANLRDRFGIPGDEDVALSENDLASFIAQRLGGNSSFSDTYEYLKKNNQLEDINALDNAANFIGTFGGAGYNSTKLLDPRTQELITMSEFAKNHGLPMLAPGERERGAFNRVFGNVVNTLSPGRPLAGGYDRIIGSDTGHEFYTTDKMDLRNKGLPEAYGAALENYKNYLAQTDVLLNIMKLRASGASIEEIQAEYPDVDVKQALKMPYAYAHRPDLLQNPFGE